MTTAEQQQGSKADAVRAELKNYKDLTDEQLAACDASTIDRYLRARQGDVRKAAKLLHGTLKWREEFNVASLSMSEFTAKELHTGRMYIAGNDPSGKSILVTRKRSDAFQPGEYTSYLRYLVFSLETAVRAMKHGQEKWVWIMDMRGYSRQNSPPLGVSMATLRILADHYPERLHKCFFIDAPSIFHFFFNALWPFIDSVTRNKIVFVNTQDPKHAAHVAAISGAADEDAREVAIAAAAKPSDPDAFDNYLRWYCSPYDMEHYKQLLQAVGWS